MDYKEFSGTLFGKTTTEEKPSTSASDRGKTLLQTLRKKVSERGAKGVIGLAKCLKQTGAEKKNISLDEFKLGLKNFKLGFDDGDVEAVFKECDTNRDSLIDSQEFVKMVKVSRED